MVLKLSVITGAIAILLITIVGVLKFKKPSLIPREVLFGNPLKASPKISPDGKKIAYLSPVDNVLNVWVKTVDQEDDTVVTADKERGIRTYFWAEDNRHIFYLQDKGGNENWRLYAVDLTQNTIKDLTPFENVQVRTLAKDKHLPNTLIIEMNKNNPKLHDVYELTLPEGGLKLLAKNPGNISSWVIDTQLKVRGALVSVAQGGFDLLVRANHDSKWEKIISWDSQDALTSEPISFSKDGSFLYLKDSRNVNAGRLMRLSLKDRAMHVISEDPQYDVEQIMVHPDTYTIQAVSYSKARHEWIVLDNNIKKDFEFLSNLDHGDFFIVSRDHADTTWLIAFIKDNGAIPYYAYDRKKGTAKFLFHHKPDLNNYTLSKMEPISFESRDGLTIHGYITYPPRTQKKRLPMVLNVHGGPWGRDTWGYHPEAQWLANRGYISLQVNFRGSTGYGKAFTNAGDKEWGGKMHLDLVDAVQWAINRGIADPTKICIYGGSYGGYAALVGATFTPDLFTCAIDLVGPSSLITFMNSIPPYWSNYLEMLHKRVGNPNTESDFLKSRSPLFHVEKIKIPMLIAQGANDPRVKQAESEQIVEAMKQKGIDHIYMLFPDEGHGFAKPQNRLKFYAATEKFLSKYLGGRIE